MYIFTLFIFAEDSIFVGNTHFSLKFFLLNRKLELAKGVHVSIQANISLFKNRKHFEKSLLTLKEDYKFKSSWLSKSILFKEVKMSRDKVSFHMHYSLKKHNRVFLFSVIVFKLQIQLPFDK